MTTIQIDNSRTKEIHKAKSIVFLLTQKKLVSYLEERFTLRQALEKMRYHGYAAMPVLTSEGEYVGTLSEGDILWYFVDHIRVDIEQKHVSDLVVPGNNPSITINESIQDVFERLLDQNFLPVVDDRNAFMGIITRKSVLQYYQDMNF